MRGVSEEIEREKRGSDPQTGKKIERGRNRTREREGER